MKEYNIKIRIEDKDGKKVTITSEVVKVYEGGLETKMKAIKRFYEELYPKYNIILTARLYNTLTETYMLVASYYGDEKRFVVHT